MASFGFAALFLRYENLQEVMIMSKTDQMTKHLIGGKNISLDEYAAYLKVLGSKPFLTAKEASTYFGIGFNRLMDMMKRPDANFIMNVGNRKQTYIHRETFEKWLMAKMADVEDDIEM